MNILVIGSGGREHSLVWKIAQSSLVSRIFTAPGNGGTKEISENVPVKADDIDGLLNFAVENKIDLTIVGPEVPLVLGIVEVFEKKGLKIFGPSKDAAMIEGSKVFSKMIMGKYGIPTADFEIFDDPNDALKYIKRKGVPLVIKADGLAAGKGSYVCKKEEEAETAVKEIMVDRIFGNAGRQIIIEDFMTGEEASIFLICDGKNFITLPSSQDHKAIFDGDQGPNTGGMGAYAPAPVINDFLLKQVEEEVISPTLDAMAEEGIPYKGVLYCGLMITAQGPKVVEFNCRFGDPETQVVLPLIENDLVDILLKAVNGKLDGVEIITKHKYAITVVLASGGYPGNYEKGKIISGIEKFENEKKFIIFHAGTKFENNKYYSNGGRVINFTCVDDTLAGAINNTYEHIDKIEFEKVYFRKDIGKKGLKYFK
ncbi:phosphoribosylamine--glycine ligase [candidate division KSB1 bacterium]